MLLLSDTDSIFHKLELHQVCLVSLSVTTEWSSFCLWFQATLQTIYATKAAGSFSEELGKWKKWFQTTEIVLGVWLEVQTKWCELEEVRLT